uniref:Uncharacterized protein n=1 Tax=Chromera velia CCMP2878 TaxID=1169474 RepID=A0A0G4IE46_9ALVE|eukprot:Cvel_13610.t1-p1 / transcript=Cvel_13610.t1 / gene=Cvel_13610 / organism=Chromera_velia_CCMP2878 / gene_product=hypothetical protein / transcript_product=hypothetical protein / location=Cvel_scaffold937:25727-26244(-) / protein_length=130 / sequence_SO=supercontig / SO=protein_coding / is_pseudo=false
MHVCVRIPRLQPHPLVRPPPQLTPLSRRKEGASPPSKAGPPPTLSPLPPHRSILVQQQEGEKEAGPLPIRYSSPRTVLLGLQQQSETGDRRPGLPGEAPLEEGGAEGGGHRILGGGGGDREAVHLLGVGV